jgi:hypothetical protein
MKRRLAIWVLGSMAAAWPFAAHAQPTTQSAQAAATNPPRIEVVRVKLLDPNGPNPRFRLRDGVVDLTKNFSLGGLEGIGTTWKMPTTIETFDARYGRW